MAVAHDSTASALISFPLNPQTVTHSLGDGSGNDRIVLAFVEAVGGTTHTFTTNDYDGVAMTQLAQITSPTLFGRITSITVFYLLDASLPATSGSYDFDFEIASGAYGSIASVSSYTGVSQVAPPTANDSDSNNPPLSGIQTVNRTPTGGAGLLVDFFAAEPQSGPLTGAPGASQTERLDSSDIDELLCHSEKIYSNNNPNSMSYTPSGSYNAFSYLVAELAEAGGGGGGGTKAGNEMGAVG